LLPGRAACCIQGLQHTHIQVLNGFDVHFAYHTHRAQGHGQQTCKGAGAGDPDKHESIDEGGTVRTAIMMIRPTKATGLGVRFEAERKARGMEMMAPTIVPKNAMQMVSNNK